MSKTFSIPSYNTLEIRNEGYNTSVKIEDYNHLLMQIPTYEYVNNTGIRTDDLLQALLTNTWRGGPEYVIEFIVNSFGSKLVEDKLQEMYSKQVKKEVEGVIENE